ncbi:MAG TPA: hypothetical protein VKS78_15995 [Roseiarcus sp.]|nr:hypothetical protein [Roseiarcus sp.]
MPSDPQAGLIDRAALTSQIGSTAMVGKFVLAVLFGFSIYGVASAVLAGVDKFSFDSKQVLNYGDY